ncbi:hypothetical protein ARMGADRAFT_1020788 [Armillaria gallica]|uniref:Uncharacterized protein n=1 Tax=Armillaria gallica TaxID=47427 RepID=A0A2H3CV62_ARMGA|nr:hypothetical protein ARMGADRAFT_1020788 [Armillaria gallica]
MFQWSLFVSSLLVLAVATPTRRDWPSGTVVCGPDDTHTPDAVKEAVLVGASRTLPVIGGELDYPRKFNNVDNLPLRCPGDSDTTFFSFPILHELPYTNGDPGPDRVIYTLAKDGPVTAGAGMFLRSKKLS